MRVTFLSHTSEGWALESASWTQWLDRSPEFIWFHNEPGATAFIFSLIFFYNWRQKYALPSFFLSPSYSFFFLFSFFLNILEQHQIQTAKHSRLFCALFPGALAEHLFFKLFHWLILIHSFRLYPPTVLVLENLHEVQSSPIFPVAHFSAVSTY